MSVTDQSADDVQPDSEGQGGEGTGGNPAYAEYLSQIPEEARGPAEEAFKAWDANYQRTTQEAADYRKQWEPYETLGVHRLSPDDVQWALQFRQAAVENPQAVWDWAQSYAQERGLTQQQAEELQAQAQSFDEFGAGFDPQQFEQLLSQKLGPLQQGLEALTSWQQQQEQQAQLQAGQAVIDEQLAELRAQHKDAFTDKAQDWVMDRAQSKYLDDPEHAIPRAWGDYQELVNTLEKQLLQSKADAPAAPEGGGVANASVESPKGWPDARERTLQIIREANRAAG